MSSDKQFTNLSPHPSTPSSGLQPSSRAGKRYRNSNPPWNESTPQNLPVPTVLFHSPRRTCRFMCFSHTPMIPTKNALVVVMVRKRLSPPPCARCLAEVWKVSGRALFTPMGSSPNYWITSMRRFRSAMRTSIVRTLPFADAAEENT